MEVPPREAEHGCFVSIKTPRGKKKAEDEQNDKQIPRENMERDSELENATLPQQI